MRVVVVGGGAAGMTAASRVKRLNPNAEVVVVERTRWVSFGLCGIPYYISCIVKHIDDLMYYPIEEFTKRRGIRVMIESEVVDVTDGMARVRTRGREERLEYDVLVLATGAKPKRILGGHCGLVLAVGHLSDALSLRSRLERLPKNSNIVVVGGGLAGVKLAEALLDWGFRVTLVEAGDYILNTVVDHGIAKVVEDAATSRGLRIVKGVRVEAVECRGDTATLHLSNGESINAALVVEAVGREPDTTLARRLGLRLGEHGGIIVDEYMRTSVDNVYAAGDVIETFDLVTGRRVWRPYATLANKTGYVAGSNIAGLKLRFPGSVGTVATRIFNLIVAKTGLTLSEAHRAGFDAFNVTVEAGTRAEYLGGGAKIRLELVVAKDGRLLGAQCVGGDESVFWRVNIVATLVQHGADVWDLFTADIGYEPSLNPVWDPLVTAARIALRMLGGKR